MRCTDRVRCVAYQSTKTAASATAKTAVDTRYGTPSSTCSTSATIVPNTATISTANQYTHGTYRRTANCRASATTSSTKAPPTATKGSIVFTRKSEAVSPIAVVSSLVTQNRAVTAGTVLRIPSASRTGGPPPCAVGPNA